MRREHFAVGARRAIELERHRQSTHCHSGWQHEAGKSRSAAWGDVAGHGFIERHAPSPHVHFVLRTTDIENAQGTFVGYVSFDTRAGLARATFKDGKVTALESLHGADAQVEAWRKGSGAKDRPGEFVISTNPALAAVLKSGYMPYYGYGAGVVRLAIGDDWESGGPNRSSNGEFRLFLPGATLTAATKTLINAGVLSLK